MILPISIVCRWIAVGGGGYDIWRVVPRAWALIWLEMNNIRNVSGALPSAWTEQWKTHVATSLAQRWEDPINMYKPIPRKQEIEESNAATVSAALQFIRKNMKNIM